MCLLTRPVDSLPSSSSDCTLHQQPFSPGGLNCSALEHFLRNLSLSCQASGVGKPAPTLWRGHWDLGGRRGPAGDSEHIRDALRPRPRGMSLCPAALHCSQETSSLAQDGCQARSLHYAPFASIARGCLPHLPQLLLPQAFLSPVIHKPCAC